jgi:hypothetical protein
MLPKKLSHFRPQNQKQSQGFPNLGSSFRTKALKAKEDMGIVSPQKNNGSKGSQMTDEQRL